MVPRTSRNVREGWPLGKAAQATRAVSSGTSTMTCGWSDMPDVLRLRGCRHKKNRGRIMPYPAPQSTPQGRQRSAYILYYRNIFCGKSTEKASRHAHVTGTSFPLVPVTMMFILVATY